MKRPSLAARVVRGMILVALLSSLALAGASAIISRIMWRSNEEAALSATADALADTVREEMSEEGTPFEEAAPEALKDAAIAGFRLEAWGDGHLLYKRPEGERLGPPEKSDRAYRRDGLLLRALEFPGGGILLVGATDEGERHAFSVFAWSLVLSMPVCLLLAAGVGRIVGRRATRPLLDFTSKVSTLGGSDAPGTSGTAAIPRIWTDGRAPSRGEPSEIADLDEAFHGLLERLAETVRREMEFAANASHELRTPLTNMRLYAEEALRDATPAGRRAIEDQLREIDRMVRLIDSLLVMARDSQSGLPRGEAVNLADLARDVLSRLPGEAPDADLPDEAMVRGDEALLGIAVENLLDNARKFTPEGSRARIDLKATADVVRLTVTSPGARVGAGEKESLFERFYRSPEARARRDGHGLGLPLSRHIARLHGGDVACVSQPEEDARFTLDLPAWRPQEGSRLS